MTSPCTRLAAVLLATALLVTGCGAPDDEAVRPTVTKTLPPEPPTDLVDLPVGDAPIGPRDTARVQGSELRVGGKVVDLAPLRVADPAVVPGGVFFRNGTELWFTDLGRARATGYADVASLVVSPDGRRIAFLDLQHGPEDEFGTPLAISIAYDATTGKALVASYAGMGDIGTDDLADLYEHAEPAITGFDDDALVVHAATGGDWRIPLDGTAPAKIP